MRIIFVGIHNKPGMDPLDSKTKTGRTVDRIITRVKHFHGELNFIKCNLFDIDYLPDSHRFMNTMSQEWLQRLKPTPEDITVTLGKIVADYIPRGVSRAVIELQHPGRIMVTEKLVRYIHESAEKINAEVPL
jgi:hypothetical protein